MCRACDSGRHVYGSTVTAPTSYLEKIHGDRSGDNTRAKVAHEVKLLPNNHQQVRSWCIGWNGAAGSGRLCNDRTYYAPTLILGPDFHAGTVLEAAL